MTLFHTTLLMLGVSCLMMLAGYGLRQSRWGPVLMVVGTIGTLGLIAYAILSMLA